MAVDSFPVAFPIMDWLERDVFDIYRPQAGGVTGSRDFVIDRGQPKWKVSGKTRPLFPADIAAMEAFRAKLRGSSRYCTIWDPQTAYPAQYMPAGPPALNRATLGTAFDGHCSLSAIANSGLPGSVGRDLITLGAPYALPAGLQLVAGDKIELRQGVNLLSGPDFTSGWTTTDATITPNFATAPDGTSTAAKITRTATGNHYISQATALPDAAIWYRGQAWLKLGTLTGNIVIYVRDTLSGLNAIAMVCTATSGAWARFEGVGAFSAASAGNVQFFLDPANDAGSAGDTLFAWDPRLTAVADEKISLHRVLDTTAQVADGSGNLTVWVEPEVPAGFTAGFGGALANVYKPRGKFRIVDLKIPVSAKGRARPGQCTFSALSTYN